MTARSFLKNNHYEFWELLETHFGEHRIIELTKIMEEYKNLKT